MDGDTSTAPFTEGRNVWIRRASHRCHCHAIPRLERIDLDVAVTEGVGTIESRAFADCAALTTVKLPASLKTMDDDVFAGSPKVAVMCPGGSFARRWCEEHRVALG